MRKEKAMLVLLMFSLTVMIGCKMEDSDPMEMEMEMKVEPVDPTEGINPIAEMTFSYRSGMTAHYGSDGTVQVSSMPYGNTLKDYFGIYTITSGKYVELSLTHTKNPEQLNLERLGVPIRCYAIYRTGFLDFLIEGFAHTSVVGDGNGFAEKTFVFPSGFTIHFGSGRDSTFQISRLPLDNLIMDYAGPYNVTQSKFIELILTHSKLPEEKSFEQSRIPSLAYAIYDGKNILFFAQGYLSTGSVSP